MWRKKPEVELNWYNKIVHDFTIKAVMGGAYLTRNFEKIEVTLPTYRKNLSSVELALYYDDDKYGLYEQDHWKRVPENEIDEVVDEDNGKFTYYLNPYRNRKVRGYATYFRLKEGEKPKNDWSSILYDRKVKIKVFYTPNNKKCFYRDIELEKKKVEVEVIDKTIYEESKGY